MMQAFGRAYAAFLVGLAALAALIVFAMATSVVYDVALRNLGLQPPTWVQQSVEYGMLYATMFAAPLLTRQRAHVFIGSVRAAVGPRWRRAMEIASCSICFALCLFVAVFALLYARRLHLNGIVDARNFDMPRALLIGALAFGFALMAAEFARFLVRRDTMYPASEAMGL
ncbi:MAG: TRAP transporter small permease [Rhodospirillaceae bacterium]|nr:TRAP transporter small permease [Rhodospirillaceae bacterium]